MYFFCACLCARSLSHLGQGQRIDPGVADVFAVHAQIIELLANDNVKAQAVEGMAVDGGLPNVHGS